MNPIKSTDILQISDLISELEQLIKLLDKGLKDAINENVKALKDLNIQQDKTYDNFKKSNDILNKTEKNLKNIQNDTNELAEFERQLNKIKEESNKLSNKIAASNTKEGEKLAFLKEAYKSVSKEVEKIRIEGAKYRKEQTQSIKLEQAQENSIEKLQLTTNKLTKERKELNLATEQGQKRYKELTDQINKNNTQLKEYDAQIGNHQRNVGNYQSALDGLKPSFLSVAGGITAVIAIGSQLIDQIKETNKVSQQLTQTTGAQGTALDNLTVKVATIAKTYDEDYNEVIKAANTLSKEMGISFNDALNKIDEGFSKGLNNSGEFLDILKEYPAQFRAAGIDADTMMSVINTSVKEGIFSDKGADAIKEAMLRLREMPAATKTALQSIGFTSEEIQKAIDDGSAGSFEFIQEVSSRMKNFGENSKEVGEVLANVWGGAGEDAGYRYITMLADVESGLDNVEVQATDLTLAQRQLTEEWTKFMVGLSTGESFAGQIFANLTDFVGDLLHTFNELEKGGKATFRAIADVVVRLIAGPLNGINVAIKALTGEDLLGDVSNWISEMIGINETANDLIMTAAINTQETLVLTEQKTTLDFEAELKKRTDAVTKATEKQKEAIKEIDIANDLSLDKDAERHLKEVEQNNKKNLELVKSDFEAIEQRDKESDEAQKRELARYQQRVEMYTAATSEIGAALGNFLTDQESGFKNFGKSFILILLDLLEKQVNLSIAAATAQSLASPESVLTFGAAGFAKAAIMTGLIKAAFTVAKNLVTKFEGGGQVDGLWHGPTHAQGGIPATVKSTGQQIEFEGGEYIINKGITRDRNVYSFSGTPLQIASSLNETVKPKRFAEGGSVSNTSTGTASVSAQLQGLDLDRFADLIIQVVDQRIAQTKFVAFAQDVNEINQDSINVEFKDNL